MEIEASISEHAPACVFQQTADKIVAKFESVVTLGVPECPNLNDPNVYSGLERAFSSSIKEGVPAAGTTVRIIMIDCDVVAATDAGETRSRRLEEDFSMSCAFEVILPILCDGECGEEEELEILAIFAKSKETLEEEVSSGGFEEELIAQISNSEDLIVALEAMDFDIVNFVENMDVDEESFVVPETFENEIFIASASPSASPTTDPIVSASSGLRASWTSVFGSIAAILAIALLQ